MKDEIYHERSLDVAGSVGIVDIDNGRASKLVYDAIDQIAQITGAHSETRRVTGWYRNKGKRLADLAIVIGTLPLTGLITLLCALALWLEGGQPFYRQNRLGRGGRQFSILKLRTMSCDADELLEEYLSSDPAMRAEWDTTQKLKNDPRITTIGAILRSTSLDELPQLWNVIKGDMSVVGPRPMMPDQLAFYANPRAYFGLRPGMTGAWQVSDRNENSFAHRSTVDTRYNAKLSFWSDLWILCQTAGVIVRRTGY